MPPEPSYILERDGTGKIHSQLIVDGAKIRLQRYGHDIKPVEARQHLVEFLGKVFLPTGYPDTVSPDYLRYQILNALQAFCSSLATLLSNRAVLEGMGVGNASATATHALLVTVLQDVCSRLATIYGAYLLGSSLFPEAKLYRILADILNDFAIILDTLSPLFISPSLPIPVPGLRVVALCLSASLRALCSIVAGGSKTALTLHFANPIGSKGDVGDLNAKDASKETVLALSGMLVRYILFGYIGSLLASLFSWEQIVVPYLNTPWTVYPVVLCLIALHLFINYLGVRGLNLRTLNRQRATIAWMTFRLSKQCILTPAELSLKERIFDGFGNLRHIHNGQLLGHCSIGSSLSHILSQPIPLEQLQQFEHERYVLWYCQKPRGSGPIRLHICLKERHLPSDHLKAWLHAVETTITLSTLASLGDHTSIVKTRNGTASTHINDETIVLAIRRAQEVISDKCNEFLEGMQRQGWRIDEPELMTGPPAMVLLDYKTEPPNE